MEEDKDLVEIDNSDLHSWDSAQKIKKEFIWSNLKSQTVFDTVEKWLKTLSANTREAYSYGIKALAKRNLIQLNMSLQVFSLVTHDVVIDKIKLIPEWSEATKQARAACYISFTGFLSRRTEGLIRKAIPNKEQSTQTFKKVREKVKTPAMDKVQWTVFFKCLESPKGTTTETSIRDTLIGKIMLQGGKRVSEVLSLRIEQIRWEANIIEFDQMKTKNYQQETPIHYREQNLKDLKQYLNGRESGLVFITPVKKFQTGEKKGQEFGGKPVSRHHVTRSFERAGIRAKIPFKVTPHVMRASLVTHLKGLGYANSDIRRITRHSSDEMVDSYDKRGLEDNPSKTQYLV